MGAYVGRFAPSPTGPLHMGSLVAALASYLQARSQRGLWLLRIEDLDPPREPAGAADAIVSCLAAHGLRHDGDILYQSKRHANYRNALDQLRHAGRLYACKCTRAQLRAAECGPHAHRPYPGHCSNLDLSEKDNALRLRLCEPFEHQFEDAIQGWQCENLRDTVGDFVLRRRDGLYAYQLAVVVDDAEQGVTEVVRGADLLGNCARQIQLQRALGYPQPSYQHIPVLLDNNGLKLSKQNHAPALDPTDALKNLRAAWRALGQIDLRPTLDCSNFLDLATNAWSVERIPKNL